MVPQTKVVVKKLVAQMSVQTDGSTSESYLQLDLPGTEEWGPYLESIQALTVTKNATPQLWWELIVSWSNDGVSPATPFTALTGSGISSDDQTVETAVTSGFGGRIMRFAIGCKNQSGTNVETALVWVWLVFTFKS